MTDLHDAIRALGHEEFVEARDLLIAIVEEHPAWADAWALLGGAHMALAEIDQASAASERAIALAPDGFLPRMKAGELALRLGDIETSEVQFLAAVRATDTDTADAAAARQALAIARRASRSGIAHRALLPNVGSVLEWALRPVRGGSALLNRFRRKRGAREAT